MHTFNVNIDDKTFVLSSYNEFANYFGSNAAQVEPQIRQWFLQNLKPTDIIFDIGANVGLFTILFKMRTDNVYAFEPTSTYDTLLLPNLKNNKIDANNHKIAFGDKIGLHKDKIFRIWGKDPEELSYNFDTVDNFIKTYDVIPTHLKIDVDSFEYEVLLGAKDFLTNYTPTIIVEINNIALGTRNINGLDIISLMNGLGYKEVGVYDNENYIFKK